MIWAVSQILDPSPEMDTSDNGLNSRTAGFGREVGSGSTPTGSGCRISLFFKAAAASARLRPEYGTGSVRRTRSRCRGISATRCRIRTRAENSASR